jgi:hypothetical protein
MVAMLRRDRERYPNLINFLATGFPRVRENRTVWSTFLAHTRWTDGEASGYVRIRRQPYILVVPASRSGDGPHTWAWVRRDFPNSIFLNVLVAQSFERLHASPGATLWMESVILHELVHCAHAYAGREDPDFDDQPDSGDRFEVAAYGARPGELSLPNFCHRTTREQNEREVLGPELEF